MKYLIAFSLILCAFYISACVKLTQTDNYRQKPKTKVSATRVVMNFLEAMKNEDLSEAYEHVYVLNSDKEGYISSAKGRLGELGVKLLKYEILGTQLFKNTGSIYAELQIEQKAGDDVIKKNVKVRYNLRLFDKEWKITEDRCIENCGNNSNTNSDQLNSR